MVLVIHQLYPQYYLVIKVLVLVVNFFSLLLKHFKHPVGHYESPGYIKCTKDHRQDPQDQVNVQCTRVCMANQDNAAYNNDPTDGIRSRH